MDSLLYVPGQNRPTPEHLMEYLQYHTSSLKQKTSDIGDFQRALQAEGKQSLLVIFQAMDAAGKDSTIRKVFNACDPAGYGVVSFKAPSKKERAHDFMWRCYAHFPERGFLRIFNRSYYEETLIVRVHPEFLKAQGIDKKPTQKFWDRRFKYINQVERHLKRNGTHVIKFFLDVTQPQQHYRFISRYATPEKQWKFNVGDLKESQHWDAYQQAFDDMLFHTSTKHAPWYVIPADDKPMMRNAVAAIIQQHLAAMKPQYPSLPTYDAEDLKLIDDLMSSYQQTNGNGD